MKIKVLELIQSGLITKAELARQMYPGIAAASQYLDKKLRNKHGQTFNSDDRKKVENILKKYLTDVN